MRASPGSGTPLPPEGTNVLSGHPDQTRLALESFRPEPAWPGPHQVVSRAPVTVYTSPVADTGLIGDFGLTLYTGPDRAIRDHLSRVADLVAGLTHHVRPGLRYCDLYAHARRSWEAADLTNDIASTTDPAGTNIGHSIPFFASPRPEITPGPGGSLILSQNREFNSATNNAEITDTCAFTIEPRLGAPGLPVVWFHVVVVFIEGVKHVITEFDPVLAALGCSWFANPWT